MISGGNATIIVADMDRSIHFYTQVLGMQLTNRFGDDWATVCAGTGLTIGIHPASEKYPPPGTRGAMILGLDIDIPVDRAIARLAQHGVAVKTGVNRTDHGNFVSLDDPDGHEIYLWEQTPATLPEPQLAGAAAA